MILIFQAPNARLFLLLVALSSNSDIIDWSEKITIDYCWWIQFQFYGRSPHKVESFFIFSGLIRQLDTFQLKSTDKYFSFRGICPREEQDNCPNNWGSVSTYNQRPLFSEYKMIRTSSNPPADTLDPIILVQILLLNFNGPSPWTFNKPLCSHKYLKTAIKIWTLCSIFENLWVLKYVTGGRGKFRKI